MVKSPASFYFHCRTRWIVSGWLICLQTRKQTVKPQTYFWEPVIDRCARGPSIGRRVWGHGWTCVFFFDAWMLQTWLLLWRILATPLPPVGRQSTLCVSHSLNWWGGGGSSGNQKCMLWIIIHFFSYHPRALFPTASPVNLCNTFRHSTFTPSPPGWVYIGFCVGHLLIWWRGPRWDPVEGKSVCCRISRRQPG